MFDVWYVICCLSVALFVMLFALFFVVLFVMLYVKFCVTTFVLFCVLLLDMLLVLPFVSVLSPFFNEPTSQATGQPSHDQMCST